MVFLEAEKKMGVYAIEIKESPKYSTRCDSYCPQEEFVTAVKENKIDEVIHFLTAFNTLDVDIDQVGPEGMCPIHWCAIRNMRDMLTLLLNAGADIEACDPNGWTALHASCATGHQEIVSYLLQQGASPFSTTINGELPLQLAADKQTKRLLIAAMIDRDDDDFWLAHDRDEWMERKNRRLSVGSLVEAKSNVEKAGRKKSSKMICIRYSFVGSVSDDGVSSETAMPYNATEVCFSPAKLFQKFFRGNKSESLDMLLNCIHFQNLEKLNKKGLSFLHKAALKNQAELIKVLVRHGANVNVRDTHGWTPLHAACARDNMDCVRALIDLGADMYAQTDDGNYASDYAIGEAKQYIYDQMNYSLL